MAGRIQVDSSTTCAKRQSVQGHPASLLVFLESISPLFLGLFDVFQVNFEDFPDISGLRIVRLNAGQEIPEMQVADWSVSPPVRVLGIFDNQHRSIRSVLETGVFPFGGTKARRPAGDQPSQGVPTSWTDGRLLQLFEIPIRKSSPEFESAHTTSRRPFPFQQIGLLVLPQVPENLDCPPVCTVAT